MAAPALPRPGTGAPVPAPPERTARWVAALFVAGVLLQRLAIPGTEIALLLLVLAAWIAFALLHGVVVLDPYRLTAFCAVIVATGVAIALQPFWVPDRLLSLSSWALVLASAFPMTCRLVDRRPETFVLTLRHVVRCGLGLAAVCVAMTVSQLAGVGYRDVMASVLPDSLLLDGFAITYPYSYGSELYRANAWFGLEPSFVSFQLGLAVLAAVLLRKRIRVLLVLVAAMAATASGSGFLVVLAGLAVLAGWPRRRVLVRYVLPSVAALVVALLSPFGRALFARTGEVGEANSSASLRAVQPYQYLWPTWTGTHGTTLWGDGPGSSERLIEISGIPGLLVPTPAKVFFDYGVVAGLVLAAFLLSCYLGATSRAMAAALFVSLWTIQPGLTTTVLIVALVSLVTLWAPQTGLRLEDITPRNRRPAEMSPNRGATRPTDRGG